MRVERLASCGWNEDFSSGTKSAWPSLLSISKDVPSEAFWDHGGDFELLMRPVSVLRDGIQMATAWLDERAS